MIKTTLLLLVSFLFSFSLSAQRTCNCQQTFDTLVQRLHEDYIGLRLMPGKESAAFIKRETSFRKKAATTSAAGCTKFLQEFLDALNDKHVFVYENPTYTKTETDSFRTLIQRNKKNELALKNITWQDTPPVNIEGMWTDGKDQFAILKEGELYNAYILPQDTVQARGGELKASFKPGKNGFSTTLYNDQYEPVACPAKLYKNGTLLGFNAGRLWAKTAPATSSTDRAINFNDPAQPTITRADDTSVLFTIPTFNYDWESFSKMVKDSLAVLSNAHNIIFDIRGNTGGNALYFNFIELIADTNTFPGSQGWVLTAADTKKYFERQLAASPEIYKPVLDEFKANMGRVIPGPLYPDQPLELVPSAIKNVAILTDHDNLSAAESFVLHSKMVSKRVTVFGMPTGGCIDYTSVNVVTLPSGNQNILFGYPTGTWDKNVPAVGYNKTGIPPDVMVDDRVGDKIKFIIDYYHRK